MDEVTLRIGGQAYGGWTRVRIRRSLESAAGTFDLAVSERFPDRPPARALEQGSPAEVRIGTETVLAGYIDERTHRLDGSGHTVTLRGRDATADLVDCAPDLPPGEWRDVGLLRVARLLAEPFGVTVRADTDLGAPFRVVALDPGETAWSLLEELCRYRAVLPVSDGQGGLRLTSVDEAPASDPIIEGENLLSGTWRESGAERFSDYIVRGQASGTDQAFGDVAAAPEGRARDAGVARHRPLVLVATEPVDAAGAQRRAAWEATVRAGRAAEATAVVVGWRQVSGALWEPGSVSRLDSPRLGVRARLLVAEVAYVLDGQGRRTEMVLRRPDAYRGLPGGEPVPEDEPWA